MSEVAERRDQDGASGRAGCCRVVESKSEQAVCARQDHAWVSDGLSRIREDCRVIEALLTHKLSGSVDLARPTDSTLH